MKFANIIMNRKGRCTVGDDIQLLAIENLYKNMGIDYNEVVRIPFSELSTYDGDYVVLPISFPLYGYSHEDFVTCFSEKIIPVFLGFATMKQDYRLEDIEYLKRYQPIGCRDQYTMEGLRKNCVDAYLNGCITLTLPKVRNGYDDKKKIYCIDLTDDLIEKIPKELLDDCVFKNHVYMSDECENGTEEKAKEVYGEYISDAKMIVTTRMHAALPCLAFGIPVILAKKRLSIRFPMIENLIPVYTQQEYDNINWNPILPDIEDLKKQVMNASIKQIMNAYNKYNDILSVSYFYERKDIRDVYIDNFSDVIPYIENRFKYEDKFSYILWGATQTAELVYEYIKNNYNNATLIGVIDQFKKINFLGHNTAERNILDTNKEAVCIICAGAAMPEAKAYCKEIGFDNFFSCWEDGLPR